MNPFLGKGGKKKTFTWNWDVNRLRCGEKWNKLFSGFQFFLENENFHIKNQPPLQTQFCLPASDNSSQVVFCFQLFLQRKTFFMLSNSLEFLFTPHLSLKFFLSFFCVDLQNIGTFGHLNEEKRWNFDNKNWDIKTCSNLLINFHFHHVFGIY